MAACRGVRFRGFEGRLHRQVTCPERMSPVFSTCSNNSLSPESYHRKIMIIPNGSGPIHFRTERLSGYDDLGSQRRRLGPEDPGTDGEATDWAQLPAVSEKTKDASPLSGQELSTFQHQGYGLSKAALSKSSITVPSPFPWKPSLHTPAEPQFDQLDFDVHTDNGSGQSCVDDCDCEKNPGIECRLMPDLVYDNESVPTRLYPAPASELEHDFRFDTGPDMVSPTQINTIVLSNAIAEATRTRRASHRMANRSGPECFRHRLHRSVKARAQYLRNRSFGGASMPIETPTALRAGIPLRPPEKVKPKRKHCAFVQEQELRCLFEDRVGTVHLSELQPGDDVNAQLTVDELSVGGEAAALSIADGATQGLSPLAITDIPNQEPSPS